MDASINVCFSTAGGFLSRAIRWFTRAEVSHAVITFRDETLRKVFVMEANGRGFMLVPWSKWRNSNTVVARYRLTSDEAAQVESLRVLASSLGVEYDYVGIMGFFLRRFAKRMKNPLDNATKLFCSEAVARFLFHAGLEDFSEPETWTPQDLLTGVRTHYAMRAVPLS